MNDPRHTGSDWDAFLGQELKRLPPIQAPPQLKASVMRQARLRAALPWWRRSFWSWPPVARGVALASLVILGGLWMLPAWVGVGAAGAWVGKAWGLTGAPGSSPQSLGGWADWLGLPAALGAWLLQSPWFIAGLLFTGLLYLTCVAAGSALFRLAAQPTDER